MTARTRGLIATILCLITVALAATAYWQFGSNFIIWRLVFGPEQALKEAKNNKDVKINFTSGNKKPTVKNVSSDTVKSESDFRIAIIECLVATSTSNLYYCVILLLLVYHVLGLLCFEILNFVDLTLGRSLSKRSGPFGLEDLVLCLLIWPAYGPANLVGSLIALAL